VTEPVQPTHYDLGVQIAELKGAVKTIATLLEERNKNHNALEEDHKKLAKKIEEDRENLAKRIQALETHRSNVLLIGSLTLLALGLVQYKIYISLPQKDSSAIMPPVLVRGAVTMTEHQRDRTPSS
jgi:hypothetical protein